MKTKQQPATCFSSLGGPGEVRRVTVRFLIALGAERRLRGLLMGLRNRAAHLGPLLEIARCIIGKSTIFAGPNLATSHVHLLDLRRLNEPEAESDA